MDVDLEPVTYADQAYGNTIVLDRLKKQRASGRFCDVLLIVKATGRQYAAHRNVLSACSPYFDTIFRSNKVVKEHVTVTSQNAGAFEQLLEYMYSGSVVLDRVNVIDLLKLSNNFLVMKLKGHCAEYLDRHLDATNCLTINELSERYNLPGLLKASNIFLQNNVNRCLVESTDAHTYPIYRVEAIMARFTHSIRAPIALNFVLRWCAHAPADRHEHFQHFLSNIRLSDISNEQLTQMVDASPFLRGNAEANLLMLQSMLDYGIAMPAHLMQKYNQLINADQDVVVSEQFDSHQQGVETAVDGGGVQPETVNQPPDTPADSGIQIEVPIVKQEQHDPDEYTNNSSATNVQEYLVQDTTPAEDADGAGDPAADDARPIAGSGKSRGSLKLTLKLPIQNKKTRLLASTRTHNMIRRKVGAANQLLRRKAGGGVPRRPKATAAAVDSLDAAELAESDLSDWDDEMPVEQVVQADGTDTGTAESTDEATQETQIIYKCPHCVYTGPDKNRMQTHISRAHRANRIYVCTVCEFECKWNREYYLHMKQHFQGPPFACDVCEYSAERIQHMLTHRMKHTDEKPFKCTECEYRCRTKTNLVTHQRAHSGEKPFNCGECGKGFAIKSTLDQHLATHSDTRPFQCELCSFSTKYQSHLISHKRIHTGDVFHCTYTDCTYSSPKKSQLAAHLRTHLAVRAHTCKQCHRSFIEKSHLVRHERIHLAEKPFKCDSCEYASSRRDKLKEHILKHHGAQSTLRQKQRKYRRQRQLAGLVGKPSSKRLPSASKRSDFLNNMGGRPVGLAQSVLLNNTFRPITPAKPAAAAAATAAAGGGGQVVVVGAETAAAADHSANATGNAQRQQQNVFTTPSPHMASSHRPSSAVAGYGATHHAAQPSPALSLNFNLGFESPVVSGKKDVLLSTQVAPTPTHETTLMTPTPRIGSPSGQTGQHGEQRMAQASTPSADLQRPMSLPPFGGQQVPPTNPASVPGWNQQGDFSFTSMF